jgi:hypothetical protein
MSDIGKILVGLGALLMVVGVILLFVPKIPYLGKLPGDIHIKKDNFELYIPLATSLLLSVLLSGILWFISHFGKK